MRHIDVHLTVLSRLFTCWENSDKEQKPCSKLLRSRDFPKLNWSHRSDLEANWATSVCCTKATELLGRVIRVVFWHQPSADQGTKVWVVTTAHTRALRASCTRISFKVHLQPGRSWPERYDVEGHPKEINSVSHLWSVQMAHALHGLSVEPRSSTKDAYSNKTLYNWNGKPW
jgi:hypothetical protein